MRDISNFYWFLTNITEHPVAHTHTYYVSIQLGSSFSEHFVWLEFILISVRADIDLQYLRVWQMGILRLQSFLSSWNENFLRAGILRDALIMLVEGDNPRSQDPSASGRRTLKWIGLINYCVKFSIKIQTCHKCFGTPCTVQDTTYNFQHNPSIRNCHVIWSEPININ